MSLRQFLEQKDYERIKLNTTQTGHYKFCLFLNNVKGTFILDTGASNTCVDLNAIDQYNLFAIDSDIKAAGAGAINMMTQISSDNTIKINKWKCTGVDIVLFDLSHVNTALIDHEIAAVDGIMGADILNLGKAIIDYDKNCLYLKRLK
ncbi:retropepsin-like aspartic protease [Flavimarina sp. Hel_I_48]|uniref:retropepsin-like aspartic protease n=1 Tax=Flavimarina sp. Hel_I_48 TaxID=1392488 RepID=UPI0004DF73D3|nr:retropepsin-like aspartic protease [Flavimarina sp. Hel_I_48]